MQELDDIRLLRRYVDDNSEEAFAGLVTRHINKVYSVALRHTRNPHQAEEITQAVFVILAKKARGLGRGVILSGWLYQTARLASVTFLRSEIRRARREQEAHMQRIMDEPATDETWHQIAPLLDAAIAALNETDRHAVVLRFFDGKSLSEVGAVLGATEDAAKKRVSRALERLQRFFAKRGVNSTTAIIAGTISSNSVQAAPAALAKSVTAIAFSKGTAAGGTTLTLIKGAMKIMAWTKAKMAIVTVVVVLVAAGVTTVTVKEIQRHKRYPWQVPKASFELIQKFPPQVVIVPTAFKQDGGMYADFTRGGGMAGICQPLTNIIRWLYAGDRYHLVLSSDLPTGRYDFFAKGTKSDWGKQWKKALEDELKSKLGVVGKLEVRNADVLLLQYSNPNAGGLRPPDSLRRSMNEPRNMRSMMGTNSATFFLSPVDGLKDFLQAVFEKPVVDRTGLKGIYDYRLTWEDPDNPDREVVRENTKRALFNELGMELVPTNMPAEMLVVEKTQ
jgi:uncharacterized protein (TIGR03435 family)